MRILIAETSWASMTAAKDLSRAGFLLTRADDGADLLEYSDLSEQNMILFDTDLPDMSALDCLRRLRASNPEVGICLLADLADKSFVVRALSLGADDVIARKADAAEIVARVQAVTRRRAGLAAPMVETGGLVIDSLGRRVLVGHNEVPLTRLEYELLELLALRQGRIVTRDEIMAQLYALNEAPDAKIIGVYVHHIRAKITSLGGDGSLLENVRGRGYALAAPAPVSAAA